MGKKTHSSTATAEAPALGALTQEVKRSNIGGVRALLKAGADIEECVDNSGRTPLLWAATRGDVNMMKILITAGAELHKKTAGGDTLLTTAIRADSMDALKLLLEQEAVDPLELGPGRQSPEELARLRGNMNVVYLLRETAACRRRAVEERERAAEENLRLEFARRTQVRIRQNQQDLRRTARQHNLSFKTP